MKKNRNVKGERTTENERERQKTGREKRQTNCENEKEIMES